MMSYDLFFCVPEGHARPAPEDVQAYFDARPLFDVGNREALYRNEDTRTLFRFTWGDEASDEARAIKTLRDAQRNHALSLLDVRFELHYARPRVYALEAEPELAAFASHFGLAVFDPQARGMGTGAYSREGFLRGWTHGNRAALAAAARSAPAPRVTLPAEVRERHWRWNLGRAELERALGPGVVVPLIAYVRHDARVCAAVIWGDASNIALPEVELILLARQAIAPRRYFLFRRPSAALIEASALAPHRTLGEEGSCAAGTYWLLRAKSPPRSLVRFFNAHPPFRAVPEGLPAESVFEAEEVLAVAPRAR